jgi:hypothetical protein
LEARWKLECERRKEREEILPTFLSPPLNLLRVFNWSKLIFHISFFLFDFIYFIFISFSFVFIYFISFAFWLCGSLAFYSFVESLLLVNMPPDRY